jgi:hypothetical protein
MRRAILIALLLALALPAAATEFNEDNTCVQNDGQAGLANGTTRDDGGCVTPAEYESSHSVAGLLDAGVITEVIPVDKETVRVKWLSWQGSVAWNNLLADPWMRPISANIELEPDALTARVVWDFWMRTREER